MTLDYLRKSRLIATIAATAVFWLSMLPLANAAIVSTDDIVAEQQSRIERDTLLSALDREEVQQALMHRGVDLQQARLRVNSMTDEEVAALNQGLDELPAGSGVGSVVGAAVIVFLVLLLTDILGYTDIFPFVKKHKAHNR